MTVDLDKKGLVCLVMGVTPNYGIAMETASRFSLGRYIGGFHDKWEWSRSDLEKISEEDLWSMYKLCKDSWK